MTKHGIFSHPHWATALIVITPALWSLNYMVGRLAPGYVAPHMLALLRWSVAGLLLAGFAWPELWAKRALIKKNAWHYLVFGALGMWICGAWVYIGARSTSTANIALIYALAPVFIALLAAAWLKEKLGRWQWLGIGMAFVGLVHVVIKGQWASLKGVELVAGDGWILAATVSWTLYSTLLKRWPSELSPIARLVMIIAGGVALLLPVALLEAGSGLPIGVTQWGWRTAALVLVAGIFPGAGAYWAYATMQKSVGAARAALSLYLSPLFAAVLAWLLLGEPVFAYHAVGAAIILPGLFLASRQPS